MKKLIFISSCIIFLIYACDKVDPPIWGCMDPLAINYDPAATKDDESCESACMDENASNYNPNATFACDSINPSNDCCVYDSNCFDNIDTSNIIQKVLIEDFTGHKCPNCPEAAEELHVIQNTFPGRVIGMAIHAGFFAKPNASEAPFLTTDFRTDQGTEIHDRFNPEFYPIGLINRIDFDNNHLKQFAEWGTITSDLLNNDPKLGICIQENSGMIGVSILALENLGSDLKLVIAITEDNIIDWQIIEGQGNVQDYEHNHVLRDVITPAFGDEIGSFDSQEVKTFNFSYELNSSWIRENCNIIAYVFRDNNNNQEVLQVEELHLE